MAIEKIHQQCNSLINKKYFIEKKINFRNQRFKKNGEYVILNIIKILKKKIRSKK